MFLISLLLCQGHLIVYLDFAQLESKMRFTALDFWVTETSTPQVQVSSAVLRARLCHQRNECEWVDADFKSQIWPQRLWNTSNIIFLPPVFPKVWFLSHLKSETGRAADVSGRESN